LRPQLWKPPALTAVKAAFPGGLAWPEPSSPQQNTAPLVRTPQL
jgi:hypothetical protein